MVHLENHCHAYDDAENRNDYDDLACHDHNEPHNNHRFPNNVSDNDANWTPMNLKLPDVEQGVDDGNSSTRKSILQVLDAAMPPNLVWKAH